MSFILDAVKKSEQDRRFTHAEPLQTWYHQGAPKKTTNHRWVVLLVVMNSLVLTALVLWVVEPAWLMALKGVEVQSANSTDVVPAPQVPVQQAPVQQAPVQQAPVQQAPVQQTPVQQTPVQQTPVQQTPTGVATVEGEIRPQGSKGDANTGPQVDEIITPTGAYGNTADQPLANSGSYSGQQEVVDLEQLPESLVIHVPAIAFSSHLYSNEPAARQVVVNGQKLREGDYLNQNLQLLEIQEKSVIFQQFQTPFRVVLSRYWVRSQ